MNTIQIPIDNARRAYELARSGDDLPTVLEVLLGTEAITPLRKGGTAITTWDDVLAYHKMTQAEFNTWCIGLTEDEIGYRMCKLIVPALNDGWTPDWSDGDQVKYWPWMQYKPGSGFSFDGCVAGCRYSSVGSRLCLKSRELAIHYAEHFAPAINKFFL